MTKTRDKSTGSLYPHCVRKGKGHDEGSHRGCRVDYWVAQVELPRTADGKRRYSRVRRSTKAEAREALAEQLGHVEAGVVIDRNSTVATFLERWLTDVVPTKVKPESVKAYRKVTKRWIVPYVGHVKLGELTATQIAGMMADLEAAGYAPRTRAFALSVLRRALRWAEQTRIVGRNEASLVDGPRLSNRVHDALTAAEARAVLDAAKGDRFEALAVVALKLGLRKQELLDLKWADIDTDAGTLTVIKSKTESGIRTIPLVNGTAEVLAQHRRRQAEDRIAAGPLWQDRDLVFAWEDGRPVSARAALRWWHGLTTRALGERRRFHASRHTCATLLLDAGVPLEVVSAVLGHSTLAMTADLYARPSADLKRRALVKMDEFLAEA